MIRKFAEWGAALSDLRIQRNLTQEDVVSLTGIPYNTYRRYEYGESFPKKDAIIALAKLYGIRPGEMFEILAGVRE